jgi:hypothetical protein
MSGVLGLALPLLLLSAQTPEPPAATLEAILTHEAEYCRRLESAALDFVCLEDIVEKIDQSKDIASLRWQAPGDRPPTSIKRTFLYDFQFVRKGFEVKESRTLLRKNGKETFVMEAGLETRNFVYRNAVLAPLGIFGENWREAFAYRIVGEGRVGGRPCVIVEAVPERGGREIDLLSGRAFIDQTTLEILKIEWSEKRIGNYEVFEERAKRYAMRPLITVISEFEVEKNGIRFPSRHLIEESYYGAGGMERSGRFVRSRTTIVYRDFKFFTVTVEKGP